MEKSFFLPINSGGLAHYFGRAIILPAKYYSNKPEDIQNTVSDSILLSTYKWIKNSDCSLEVILTDSEIKDLIQASDHFIFFSNTPIPISRVKSVFFLDERQKETTVWNTNNGAAFIPESIVFIEKDNALESVSHSELKSEQEFEGAAEFSNKIKKFDIILGGFAFMRLGGKSFMNYSPNYFSTLSYFNKLIEEQTNSAEKEKGLKFSSKYIGLFSRSESEWSKWQQYIYQNLESEDIEQLAEKEGEKLEKALGLLKIDSINQSSHLYELAILATYGDRKNKSTDNLVTDLTNGTINPEKVEDVSILFGLNNGYAKLRNKYRGAAKDYNVKFTLESKLDYYTIESVFQFVFHGSKANYSFSYIDNWCPLSKKSESVKGYETYKILDTLVIAKKKQTPLEFFLENYSEEIYSTITKSVNQWLPPFAKVDQREAVKFFERQLKSILAISIEAFQKRVEIEFESIHNSEKRETVELFQKEIDKLSAEISNLQMENSILKNAITNSHVTEHSIEMIQNEDDQLEKDVSTDSDPVNLAPAPQSMNVFDNYSSFSISELKKIAKQKGISETSLKGFKKENKNELIALIRKTPEPPKFL